MRCLILMTALGLVPLTAAARGGGKGFGLGLALGEPTGLNGKLTLGEQTALDGTLGLNFLNGDGFSVHLCFLWAMDLTRGAKGALQGYLGLGGKLGVYSDSDHHNDDGDGVWLGGRAPAGLAFVFSGAPVDIWLEVAAVLWVVENAGLDVDGTLGVRYWF